ncbi:efflux RND transporter periplasmic adaptor subunit [Candidatus Parabeggiatoa sp. HSG14]|uniref:efflux RND transporter periplasmic adaptor subunit n=1 Tax=Candidatus Parabeggiatoa sp. HSG14 TaxID=3055593 RepID=UPI0025A8EBF3|nr:efflux RND transporter periplasmic adaptor subunit [Thiotrichales bacterium HSG14]
MQFNKINWIMGILLISTVCLNSSVNALEELDCVIEPQSTVEVSSATVGVLASVRVDKGDKVKKGQLLARLQSGVEEANVQLAKMRADSRLNIMVMQARYELNQRSQDRLEELIKTHATSEKELDEARARTVVAKHELEKAKVEQQLAQLELKRAKEVLELRSIRSPINGVVVKKFKSAGEYVDNQQQPVLKLAKVDLLNVEVVAPVSLFGSIKKGMKAKVMPKESIGGIYTAKVFIVDPIIDAASGTFGIRLHLPNKKYKIPAGVGCQVEFINSRLVP